MEREDERNGVKTDLIEERQQHRENWRASESEEGRRTRDGQRRVKCENIEECSTGIEAGEKERGAISKNIVMSGVEKKREQKRKEVR